VLLDLPRRRMTRSRAGRRLLLAVAVIIAVVLVAGTDGWIVRHFGAHAATARGTDSFLSGIACPSATTCWAVGQSAVTRGGNTASEVRSQLIERETGGAWHRVAAPAAPGRDLALTAITCPASRDCWAVGGSSQNGPAIIEHWTGGTWHLARSPTLSGGQLMSVSCASVSLCWASGGKQSHRDKTSDVLEQWDGTGWRLIPGLDGGLRPTLFACPAAGHCLIAGLRGGAATAVSYNLGQWRPAALPAGPQLRPGAAGARQTAARRTGAARLPDFLSCADPTNCLALLRSGRDLIAEHWNGSSWTPAADRPPPYLADLACAGDHGCWLLGTSDALAPLALRWTNGSWVRTPVAGASQRGYLGDLACGTRCWAIGGRTSTLGDGSSYSHPLIGPVAGT
jgi:hypothetical protein